MFSFIFDQQLALHYDIPTYSVKNSDTTDRYGQIIIRSVVSVSSVLTSVIPQVNAPRHNPSRPGRYPIYLPRRDGRLS